MFFLFNTIIAFLLGLSEGLLCSPEVIGMLYTLAVLIPCVAVSVRRLHDTGRSGWWFLIGFIPLIGTIVLLVFMVQEGEDEPNDFGENPKSVAV